MYFFHFSSFFPPPPKVKGLQMSSFLRLPYWYIYVRTKQIHRNNKIRLYKTLIKPILCYGSVTWALTQTAQRMLNTFEKNILRRIYGRTQEGGYWRPSWNSELYSLYNQPNIMQDIKIRRLGWAGHVIRKE